MLDCFGTWTGGTRCGKALLLLVHINSRLRSSSNYWLGLVHYGRFVSALSTEQFSAYFVGDLRMSLCTQQSHQSVSLVRRDAVFVSLGERQQRLVPQNRQTASIGLKPSHKYTTTKLCLQPSTRLQRDVKFPDKSRHCSCQWFRHVQHNVKNVKSFPSHKAHRAALISVSLAHSQTPVYTARPRIRGNCIVR